MQLISVIILTHNQLAVTRRCLPTLLQPADAPWELIVIDNGSTDGTQDWLERDLAVQAREAGVEFRLIRNAANAGCSTARNQGIAAARGDCLVFQDNDVALRSRLAWARLRQELETQPKAAMVGPKLVYPTAPHAIQCAGVGISPRGRVLFRGRGEDRLAPEYNTPREVQCLISACCMVRAAVLRETGGFDEAFNPVQFEDFDLCYRIRERGWQCRYVPSVEMYHFESTTTAGTPTIPNTYVIVKNGLRFKERWRHLFESENGPPDSAATWRQDIPPTRLETLAELPLTD